MKKISLYGIATAVFILISFFVFSSFNQALEDNFLGSWEESYWEYKEADNFLLKGWGIHSKSLSSDNVRVHKGETWTFKPGGKLEILVGNTTNKLHWSLKGRGNILEISDGKVTEHFDIKKLADDQIELQLISDIQVKEEAKLIFTQTNKI